MIELIQALHLQMDLINERLSSLDTFALTRASRGEYEELKEKGARQEMVIAEMQKVMHRMMGVMELQQEQIDKLGWR
ncbi:MAG: hypothetical protein HN929_12580 [Chloroflexi bacterium]|jgi:hypothetical protein|nr:hypothetical protein [Chloroflexota bacterium]